jgi:predicted phage tail protein
MTSRVPVCAMPSLDPAFGRIEIDVPAGLTVAQIIAEVLPRATDDMLDRARVWLVTNIGETLLSVRAQWRSIRPRAGVRVMIKLVPAGDDLKNALLIAVSIGASALGQFWVGPALGGGLLGAIGGAAAAAGVTLVGGYLVNLLIPPAQTPGRESERPLYQISGWNNAANPDGAVPSILGRIRVAPLFAAPSYTEIVGDEQYVRALFTFGYGPVELSDLRLKDTPLSSFNEVEYEIREGYADDDPITLYPQQVIEEVLGVELRRDRIRDDAGNITGTGPETPIARFSAGDATEGNIILSFPTGLGEAPRDPSGGGLFGPPYDPGTDGTRTVQIRIRQRPSTGGAWSTVATLTISSKKLEGFYRTYRWAFPSRGRWEVECTRLTHETEETGIADRTVWLSLQSFRPEKPVNFDKPLCFVALRIRATYQLNSQIDSFNALAERLVLDWDHEDEEWVLRKTRNPAAFERHALQGPECAFPEPDSALDLQQYQDFHDFCRIKGLKYDRIHDTAGSQWDKLTEIAGAGRAAPRFDGVKWGVVIDKPQDLVVAHVNQRNSRDFRWSRSYPQLPDAFRISFLDETSDYQQRERVVRRPGYAGAINVTEQMPMPGKTDPDEIWIEGRRRFYEILNRPDQFSAVQDGAVRTATRGDWVKGSYDTLTSTQAAHRVTAVRGNAITMDGYVEMEAGESYALRFMRKIGEGDDATFESTLRSVIVAPGMTDTVTVTGAGNLPSRDDLVMFGIAGQESIDLVVAGTQAGEGMTTVLTMLAAAPVIDELTDAEVPPAWNGRAGDDAGVDVLVPAIPTVTSVSPYFDEAGDPDGVRVSMEPGPGSAAVVGFFQLRHRLAGDVTWTVNAAVPVADGGDLATGYAPGADIEMQRLATSIYGYSSAWSDTFNAEGATTPPLADPQPPTAASVTPGTGAADFSVTTPNDPLVAAVGLYYSAASDGTGSIEIVTFAAVANTVYSRPGETVPAGTWYFFAITENSEGSPSVGFAMGSAIIT